MPFQPCVASQVDICLYSLDGRLGKRDRRKDGRHAGGRVQPGTERLLRTTPRQGRAVPASQAHGVCQHGEGFGQFLSDDCKGGDIPAPPAAQSGVPNPVSRLLFKDDDKVSLGLRSWDGGGLCFQSGWHRDGAFAVSPGTTGRKSKKVRFAILHR